MIKYKDPGALTEARIAELAPLFDVLLEHKRPGDVRTLWVYVISAYEPSRSEPGQAWTAVGARGMLHRMGLLTRLIRRPGRLPSPTRSSSRLRPAGEAIEQYRQRGGDEAAALEGVRQQLAGLRRELDDDERWERLVRLARQAGDPWNADDWPLGFDALLCTIPLCTHVAFECARCPVGRQQEGRSCAHPSTAVGRIGELVRRGDRPGLRERLDELEARLEPVRPAPV